MNNDSDKDSDNNSNSPEILYNVNSPPLSNNVSPMQTEEESLVHTVEEYSVNSINDDNELDNSYLIEIDEETLQHSKEFIQAINKELNNQVNEFNMEVSVFKLSNFINDIYLELTYAAKVLKRSLSVQEINSLENTKNSNLSNDIDIEQPDINPIASKNSNNSKDKDNKAYNSNNAKDITKILVLK
jgi:hypothetical protein